MTEKVIDDIIAEKVIQYYGYVEEKHIKSLSMTCAKMMVNRYFGDICADKFDALSYEEMEALVIEELESDFEEKVIGFIEQTHPDMSDDDMDAEVTRLEEMYKREHQEQIVAATKTAVKEFNKRLKGLKKEIKSVRYKYTT